MIKDLIKSASLKRKKSTVAHDIQRQPASINGADKGEIHHLKIDKAIMCDTKAIIIGWCTLPKANFCVIGNARIDVTQWHLRDDVAKNLNLPDGVEYGVALLLEIHTAIDIIKLGVSNSQEKEPSRLFDVSFDTIPSMDFDIAAVQFGMRQYISCPYSPGHINFSNYMTAMPTGQGACNFARAYLEAVVASESSNEGVVVGWLALAPGVQAWLEDEEGRSFSIDNAFRLDRSDVRNAIAQQVNFSVVNSGLCCHIKGLTPGKKIQLKALGEDGVYLLAEHVCQPLSADPVEAAHWLASIKTPLDQLHDRLSRVDNPLLTHLIESRQSQWKDLPVQIRVLGMPPASPTVSVIVPLYGRTDFIEHQLMEFAEDAWFRHHVELIYVLDDPRLVEGFTAQAEALHRLYKIPFKWVWGSTNRGFSGANNLGTSQAKGEYLLYLNSDAFPRQPGWAEALVMTLKQNPELGAVAPRLLLADGGMQHGGMEFLRREELGVWINHHPLMGLAPALDPHKELTTVPAVTGACLMVRHKELDAIGGWDTGYLIGDFEDSDLCLKLRSIGLTIGYLPTVELTHLERQSFKLLGEGDFRTYVVLLNATRHQSRWQSLLGSREIDTVPATEFAEAN